tara:strand:- start:1330 stop:3447 length:2118 start_codon:yes stop_codon:yes gene_type:complete
MKNKVFVLGIDGAPPQTIFGEWLDELPNIKKLMDGGCYAKLNSTDPPLSITAWASITTGKTPTDTGIFEYIYRKNGSYDDIGVMTSRNLKEKAVWEIISDKGLKSIVPYMIMTWPLKPFNGCLIAGPQRPDGQEVECVFPKELKQEIIDKFGEVPEFDIPRFRSSFEIAKKINTDEISKDFVVEKSYEIAEKNVRAMEYLIKNKEWDLFFGVIGASDKMNHMFWKYCDKTHRKYDPESKYLNTLKDFYKFLDVKLGELLALLDEDTKIILLSDHGIMKLNTRVNVTDWLIKEGYMVLKEKVEGKTAFDFSMVDWSKTKAFAIGAYEAQIFINLKIKEPEGIVEMEEYDDLIKDISEKLHKIPGDLGEQLETQILYKKKDYDGKHLEEAPDMIVYFDKMHYGSNTTLIGNDTLWSPSTAKGSDDATHSMQGIFVMKDGSNKGNLGDISYLDVAPTVLSLLGEDVPEDMKGNIIGGNKGKEIMSKYQGMQWVKKIVEENPGNLKSPGNLMYAHLPFSYDLAEKTTLEILEKYPSLKNNLDVRKIALAAGLHDIGRPLHNNQAFHEIRGYVYIVKEGLKEGVAKSQKEVEEIAQMMLPHGTAYEYYNEDSCAELRAEFSDFGLDQLYPKTLAEAIVDYADMANLNGQEVNVENRWNELMERKGHNEISKRVIEGSIDRKIKIAKIMGDLVEGNLPLEEAEKLVNDFKV